jgi:pimeloyl-ACP methyl ester carboxylesterase
MSKVIGPALLACIAIAGCQAVATLNEAPTVRQLHVNSTNIIHVEQGHGTPVVFIHGAFSDHRAWEAQRETFAKQYRYIAVDLRYHGTSPWPDDGKDYSETTHAADVAAFIRGLNVGPVHLVGRSYGTIIVIAVALEQPEFIRSIVLQEPYESSLIADPEAKKAVLDEIRQSFGRIGAAVKDGDAAKATRLFAEWANNTGPGSFDQESDAYRSMALDNARTVPLFLVRKQLPSATCERLAGLKPPVLIINGANTRQLFSLSGEAISRCIPGSQRVGDRQRYACCIWPAANRV